MVGGDGVEPPELESSRFTVCPATTYGIPAHIKSAFVADNVFWKANLLMEMSYLTSKGPRPGTDRGT